MNPQSFADTLDTVSEELEYRHHHSPDDTPGLPTGFADLDQLTGGWPTARLSVVAADLVINLEALLYQSALHLALEECPVAFALPSSITSDSAALRTLTTHARVEPHAVRRGTATARDWSDLRRAMGHLHRDADLHWLSRAHPEGFLESHTDWDQFRDAARDLVDEKSCGALFVDSIAALAGPDDDRADVARRLAGLSRELEVAVVAGLTLHLDGACPTSSTDRVPPGIAEFATLRLHVRYPDAHGWKDGGDVVEANASSTAVPGTLDSTRLAFSPHLQRFDGYDPDPSEESSPPKRAAMDRTLDE